MDLYAYRDGRGRLSVTYERAPVCSSREVVERGICDDCARETCNARDGAL